MSSADSDEMPSGALGAVGDASRLDAYLRAANVRRELFGEDDMLDRVEKLALTVIARPSR